MNGLIENSNMTCLMISDWPATVRYLYAVLATNLGAMVENRDTTRQRTETLSYSCLEPNPPTTTRNDSTTRLFVSHSTIDAWTAHGHLKGPGAKQDQQGGGKEVYRRLSTRDDTTPARAPLPTRRRRDSYEYLHLYDEAIPTPVQARQERRQRARQCSIHGRAEVVLPHSYTSTVLLYVHGSSSLRIW